MALQKDANAIVEGKDGFWEEFEVAIVKFIIGSKLSIKRLLLVLAAASMYIQQKSYRSYQSDTKTMF